MSHRFPTFVQLAAGVDLKAHPPPTLEQCEEFGCMGPLDWVYRTLRADHLKCLTCGTRVVQLLPGTGAL